MEFPPDPFFIPRQKPGDFSAGFARNDAGWPARKGLDQLSSPAMMVCVCMITAYGGAAWRLENAQMRLHDFSSICSGSQSHTVSSPVYQGTGHRGLQGKIIKNNNEVPAGFPAGPNAALVITFSLQLARRRGSRRGRLRGRRI
jgi:hypothetical protein